MISQNSRARLACVLMLAACASVAGAQGRPSAAAPTYQPGIDVLDYDVMVELPDTGNFLRGDVTVTLRRSAGVPRFKLDLVNALNVRSVAVDGHAVTAAHEGNVIDIPLDGARDSMRVRVVYDGPVSDGLIVRKDAKGRWTWFGDNWPDRTRHWLPTVDHPSDKATVSWKVMTPVGRTVVANGTLVSNRAVTVNRVRRTEWVWRESRPIATYLMVIGAGPIVRYDIREPDCHYGDEGQCVRQQVYVMPENRQWLPGIFATAGPIVSLFERLVAPFPYEKLAHVESSTRFGGMENATAIFYDGNLFAPQKVSDGLIAHETAHQWFGDAVTEREWAHLWLSEGFATYFAALWTQQSRGEAAYRAEMAKIRTQVMGDPVVASRPVIDTAQRDYLKLLNTNSYQKGGYVLYMLHQELGDSVFFAGVRDYYTRHRHGTALSDDLRASLERASGRQLGQFFDQWLRRPGVAELTIGWAHDPETGTVRLLALQDSTKGAYAIPLPVTITDAAGVVTRTVVNISASPRAIGVVPGQFAAKPRSIVFDADARLLARITRL